MKKSVELVMPVEMHSDVLKDLVGGETHVIARRNRISPCWMRVNIFPEQRMTCLMSTSKTKARWLEEIVGGCGLWRINSRIDNEDWENQNAVSFQNGCALTEAQAVSRPMAHSFHVTGHCGAASTLMKRQKQGFTSSNHGQSSTSATVDSEFLIPSSSMEPLNSRSTRNHSDSGPHILDPDHPVIEVDGFSLEVRHYGSDYRDASSNGDSDDRARQVEADEMLAYELQEQLYHESPGVEDEEFGALITSARQQEESSQHSYSGGSQSCLPF